MEPYIGEIRAFGFNFAPVGWAPCNGQLLPIAQNTALFSILGTTYGGDGRTTFGLPNLQGCVPMAAGQGPGLSNRDLGEAAGEATVTLMPQQLAAHNHTANCATGAGNQYGPAGNYWAQNAGPSLEYGTSGPAQMSGGALSPFVGAGQPHPNMQPYVVLNYCIAVQGIYPPRS